MKKLILMLVVSIMMIGSSYAKEAGKFSVYPVVGYTMFDSDTIDNALHYGIGFEYTIISNLAIELNYLMSSHDVEFNSSATAEMDVATLSVYGAYYFPVNDVVSFKVKAGLIKHTGDAEGTYRGRDYSYMYGWYTYTSSYKMELDGDVEFSVAGGAEFNVTANSSIGVEVGYWGEDVYGFSGQYKWMFG